MANANPSGRIELERAMRTASFERPRNACPLHPHGAHRHGRLQCSVGHGEDRTDRPGVPSPTESLVDFRSEVDAIPRRPCWSTARDLTPPSSLRWPSCRFRRVDGVIQATEKSNPGERCIPVFGDRFALAAPAIRKSGGPPTREGESDDTHRQIRAGSTETRTDPIGTP
jgi:hypothetical protein